MIISFSGHSLIFFEDDVKEIVKEQIRSVLVDNEDVTCYLGGYGDFDRICANACKELKKEYTAMKLIYITPYMSLAEQNKIKEMQSYGFIDSSIYPSLENVPPKYAILKRNEWMMVNADLIIAYVEHSYGGAYKALQVAKRRCKKIINVYDFMSCEDV